MKIVNELNELVKEEITIDSRVHSRLIGARGRNIRKIMDEYKVDIKFPRSDDPDPNLVIITGSEDGVLEVKDHLLMLEEEYVSLFIFFFVTSLVYNLILQLQDVADQEHRESFRGSFNSSSDSTNSRKSEGNGFVVQGGPWEQRAPNTASVTEFPSFGGSRVEEPPQTAPVSGAWGPRR